MMGVALREKDVPFSSSETRLLRLLRRLMRDGRPKSLPDDSARSWKDAIRISATSLSDLSVTTMLLKKLFL